MKTRLCASFLATNYFERQEKQTPCTTLFSCLYFKWKLLFIKQQPNTLLDRKVCEFHHSPNEKEGHYTTQSSQTNKLKPQRCRISPFHPEEVMHRNKYPAKKMTSEARKSHQNVKNHKSLQVKPFNLQPDRTLSYSEVHL